MRIFAIVLLVIVAFGVILGLWIYGTYNGLVNIDEETNKAYAQVDVVLQRRFDLIPNLVETVKGYAAHEKDVLTQVTEARASVGRAANPQERIGAENQLTGALARLLVVAEAYPQLKANQNFLALQDELSGTENRIAVERRRYNEALKDYNTYIGLFPNNVIAGFAGFSRNDHYFEAAPASREAPKVQFPGPKG